MNHYHFIQPSKDVYTHINEIDDEPFVFEAVMEISPLDMDDPEVAYHEYLAERFSR